MASYQKVIVVGNLGSDPTMRYTPSGTAVTSFSLAANRSYNNNAGEKVTETTWYRVTTWGKQAEVCNQYLKKGSLILAEGRMTPDKNGSPRIWEKTDGTPAASFELNASDIVFLSTRTGANGEQVTDQLDMGGNDTPDEIPF